MARLQHVRTADGSTIRIHGLVLTGAPRAVPMTALIQAFIVEGVLVKVCAGDQIDGRTTTMTPRNHRKATNLGG